MVQGAEKGRYAPLHSGEQLLKQPLQWKRQVVKMRSERCRWAPGRISAGNTTISICPHFIDRETEALKGKEVCGNSHGRSEGKQGVDAYSPAPPAGPSRSWAHLLSATGMGLITR